MTVFIKKKIAKNKSPFQKTGFALSVAILQPYYVALEVLNCLFLFLLSFVFYIHSLK